MAQGGYSHPDLIPYRPEGNYDADHGEVIIGSHRGPYAVLNVRNPLPDHDYSWLRMDHGQLMTAKIQGYERVKAGDPDWCADPSYDPNDETTWTEAEPRVGDVVLLRIPQDRLREKEQAQIDAAQAQLGSAGGVGEGGLPFEQSTTQGEAPYASHRGGSLRYRIESGGPGESHSGIFAGGPRDIG